VGEGGGGSVVVGEVAGVSAGVVLDVGTGLGMGIDETGIARWDTASDRGGVCVVGLISL